jgi:hypothetical protein
MDDAAPVRITFHRGSAAAVNRRFIGGFFVFAILFAGAAFYRPAIQAFAVGFPIYLVWWKLRLRTATKPGSALVVSREGLRLEGDKAIKRIERADVARVDFVSHRSGVRMIALNGQDRTIFKVLVEEGSQKHIEGALRALGWPLDGPLCEQRDRY